MEKIRPTDSEMEILQILWNLGKGTVREINNHQNQSKKVGYTTTLKIMQIMTDKGLLERDESTRTHVYIPVVQEDETKGAVVNRLMETVFGGSATGLVMQALGNKKPTQEEIIKIRKMLDELEGGK